MNALINQAGIVSLSTPGEILIDLEDDCFFADGIRIYDPAPSSGALPMVMDIPEQSCCEYQIVDGTPVRIASPSGAAL